MENNTATIQFEVPDTEDKTALHLLSGVYTATVKQVDDDPIQYQLSNFKHSGKDHKAEGENQLIFMRNDTPQGSQWLEAFHNSRSQLVELIGREIEKAFNVQMKAS
jgi:hypothetical protein